MPTEDYIVNIDNHNFDFFEENMGYEPFWDKFGDWYAQGKSCACMIGIRTDESLNRYRAIMNKKKGMINDLCWTKRILNMSIMYTLFMTGKPMIFG